MTTDEALTEYIAAWQGGMAPSLTQYLHFVADVDRDELAELIAAFLEIAPTVEPHPARLSELEQDPLVQRLAKLEDAWWDGTQH